MQRSTVAGVSEPGSSFDVVAIGHAIVDILATVDDEQISRQGLSKGTMSLVDRGRAEKIYASLGPATEVSGGSAGNTAVGLAELGSKVAFHARVADDELGRIYTHDLRAAGVTFDPHGRAAGSRPNEGPNEGPDEGPDDGDDDRAGTGRCLVMVTEDAERTMATYLGAAAHLRIEHLDFDELRSARHVYIEGYLWDDPQTKEALREAMGAVRSAGGSVALSLSDPFCVERHRDEMIDLVAGSVDILFANEAEICLLHGTESVDEALVRVKATPVAVTAVTLGAAGSVVVTDNGTERVPAAPVAHLVDTTGAGDLYAAGFLHALQSGAGPGDCARLGGLCAAEVIGHLGARPQVPLRRLAEGAGLSWPARPEGPNGDGQPLA